VALASFRKVLEKYPDNSKAADAMLKIGYIEYEKGQFNEARQTLQQVGARYPNTMAANLAQQRVERMQREGH